jgi:PAS domain S-box-containing protein
VRAWWLEDSKGIFIMGAANVLMTPRKDQSHHRSSIQTSYLSHGTPTLVSTLRLIIKTDSARHAFLCFLHQEKKKRKEENFIKHFFYLENKSKTERILSRIGRNSSSFHNYATVADQIRDDPSLSLAFLNQLEGLEQYLMVVSVICDLNEFMRSDWHALWQQVEMQSVDPPPHMFPPVCGEISEKFSSYESELQNLLRTLTGTSVLDLLVGCLKSLPFPLVVMEMTVERQWFPITTVNSAFEELSGFSEHELIGSAFKALNPNLNIELITRIRSEILTGQVSKVMFPLYRNNGIMMACAIGAIPLVDANHTIIAFLVLFDEITASTHCLSRLKIFSDLVDAISSDLNISPSEQHLSSSSSAGYLI